MKNRRVVVIAAIAVVVVIAIAVFAVPFLRDSLTPAVNTGTPAITDQFSGIKTKVKTTPTSTSTGLEQGAADQFVAYTYPSRNQVFAQQSLYASCTTQRGSTPTPTGNAATMAATAAVGSAATADAVASGPTPEPDFIVMKIVGDESEACYQVGEVFINQGNQFNLAVGVTKAINGEVAVDRADLANSQLGDVVIDISQFKSDNPMRDGQIRRNWLQSNTFPIAKLTKAKAIGLPARAYKDGEILNFQITGNLNIHNTDKQVTFDTSGSLTGNTLVVTARIHIQMSDFGVKAPDIGGMIKANNDADLILNLVFREPTDSGTPQATQTR